MQAATYSDQPKADQDIPEEEWPDLDKPPQAAEEGETSKLTGKAGEGEGSKSVGKSSPTGAEGGAEAPPDKAVAQAPTKNPQGPQPGTSKDDQQDPTNNPQDPQAGDIPGLEEYVDSYMQAAQERFDNVQTNQLESCKSFCDTLLEIGNPTLKG